VHNHRLAGRRCSVTWRRIRAHAGTQLDRSSTCAMSAGMTMSCVFARQARAGRGGLRPRRALAHLPDHLRAAGAALPARPAAAGSGGWRAISSWRGCKRAEKHRKGAAAATADVHQLVRVREPMARRAVVDTLVCQEQGKQAGILFNEPRSLHTGSASCSVSQPAPRSWLWGSAAMPCTGSSSSMKPSCESVLLSPPTHLLASRRHYPHPLTACSPRARAR